ncbi:MAG: cytochrome d ubiquinol oxidase subunit II [Ktedonobacterales bacterium]|nr:cytochrome d ubiquinol oxidase subunit II [Ktedonobacterales bacterium]
MDLNTLWFILITVLFSGFFFLEGFDYGVGIVLPFLGKNDAERRQIISSIGPFWDGNEVWLLTAGGAMFAAFPNWYATLFSGFYLALVVMLLALITRGVAFEFRSKIAEPRWRNFWDWAICISSFVPALLWGVALVNILEGVPIDRNMNYLGTFLELLNPYALLGGVTAVALFTVHGTLFLAMKTEGPVFERASALAKRLWLPLVGLLTLIVGFGYLQTDVFTRLGVNPGVAPIMAGMAALFSGWLITERRFAWAFGLMGTTIVLSTVTVFLGMFPRVLISSINPNYSLTIYNASSSPYTLGVMTIVALVFVPIVLGYQIWNYYVFRARVTRVAAHEG